MRITRKQTIWTQTSVPSFCEEGVKQMIAEGKTFDEIEFFINQKCSEKQRSSPSEEIMDNSYTLLEPEDNNGFATAEIWDDNEGGLIYHNGEKTELG
jgi:hypothetical protein